MNLVKMYTKVYEKPRYACVLKLVSHFCEVLFGAIFLGIIYKAYVASPKLAIAFCVLSLLSFIIVSIVRRLINAPRPADLFPELDFLKSKKSSPAFPSRHTFSAALIATLAFYFSYILGGALLLFSLLLGASRVLLAKHLPRDVVCGWILGVVCGALALAFSYNVVTV